MSIDRIALGNKIKRYREQFNVSIAELSAATGITTEKIYDCENGLQEPTGDEVLVLADFFMCDYKFFVSNEKLTPLDQTEALFRRYGSELTNEDRWAIQEVLYFADNEYYLSEILNYQKTTSFVCNVTGANHKNHGKQAAEQLRTFFNYSDKEIRLNIYDDFRKIGLFVYRRKLNNSQISGMCIKHPVVGNCIIVNCDEDVYPAQTDHSLLLLSHATEDRYRPSMEFSAFIAESRKPGDDMKLLFTSRPSLSKVSDFKEIIHPPVGPTGNVGDVRLSCNCNNWSVEKHAICL